MVKCLPPQRSLIKMEIMPTNLSPEALEAEQRYRDAATPAEKIARLEEYISAIPKHKGTDKLRADLRKKLSKLKSASQGQKGAARQVSHFHIDREGAGQIALVGPPNVGKSALVAVLTNADPEVSPSPYTTWTPLPGMMPIDNVQVQLIDTPPLTADYIEPQLIELIRRADLILLVVDIQALTLQELDDTAEILAEYRIIPQHYRNRYADVSRLSFKPMIVLVNKCDTPASDEDFEVLCELLEGEWPLLPVSAVSGRNLDEMKQAVYAALKIMRVYSKPPGTEPDYSAPFVMHLGGTVEEFAAKVHKDFLERLKSARIWGKGVFDGQMVGRDHVLHEGDVVELRM